MAFDALVYLIAVIVVCTLLFGMVFFFIMLTDLESDYINPIDLCNKLNQFVIPEMLGHFILSLIFLLSLHIFSFIFNLPLLCYNIYKVSKNKHMFDATDIFRTLTYHKQECFAKLAFYLVSFFIFLYCMIMTLVES